MRLMLTLLALIPALNAQQPAAIEGSGTPSAETIMARVAENQDASESARTHYLYIQHADVISRKGKTVRCEEKTESRVVPTANGFAQKLLKLDGRLLVKDAYVTYSNLPRAKKDDTSVGKDDDQIITVNLDGDNSAMDRELVESMREDLTKSHTKDGIAAGLFPLTSKSQAAYEFHLIGQEKMNGRDVYHLTFAPKDRSDYDWKGDAYIDTTAYEPVVVRTTMSRKIPFAVRAMLGTSLPGLGFTVIYAPEPGGVWFPVSFGTEFKLKVLFFFHRELILSAQNRDFEQTHVTSKILPAALEATPSKLR